MSTILNTILFLVRTYLIFSNIKRNHLSNFILNHYKIQDLRLIYNAIIINYCWGDVRNLIYIVSCFFDENVIIYVETYSSNRMINSIVP